ncbi:GntR family transcriptional regulator [Kribbella sp. NPDC051620]|uniref:GntR family transcriptional regulator n=1 Tax=Kribbella sp. NPDC051620 TaxID=3364120 RepID=UPI0037AF8C47
MKLSDAPGPAYARVEATIRAAISSGELQPGEQLPAGPKLATEFGVALMTVRKAIDNLRAEGLLHSSHGVGVFVADGRSDAGGTVEQLRRDLDDLRDRVAALEQQTTALPPE